MIITRTPLRISLFGGGTDFPEFYTSEYGPGEVVALAIDKYCYIAVHDSCLFAPWKYKVQYSETECVDDVQHIKHPLVRACLTEFGSSEGLEIVHAADIPARTGLGSSSAFTVGLLHAMDRMGKGGGFHRESGTSLEYRLGLARKAVYIEREVVKDLGGHQDQFIVALGGARSMEFRRPGVIDGRSLLPVDVSRHLLSKVMLFYAGGEDQSKTIMREQISRVPENHDALIQLRDIARGVSKELHKQGSLKQRPWDLGFLSEALRTSWDLKRRLAGGISFPAAETIINDSIVLGAYGGKVLGAGGRGFVLIMAEDEAQWRIRAKFRGVFHELKVELDTEGSVVL